MNKLRALQLSNLSSFISSDLTVLEEGQYLFVLGLKFLHPVDATPMALDGSH